VNIGFDEEILIKRKFEKRETLIECGQSEIKDKDWDNKAI